VWNSAPFQSMYQQNPGSLSCLSLMPEWYLLLASFGFLTALGNDWRPLLWSAPLFAAASVLTLLEPIRAGVQARLNPEPRSKFHRIWMRTLIAVLHLMQPLARLIGRLQHGLGPWNWKGCVQVAPLPAVISVWAQDWESSESRLSKLHTILEKSGARVLPGGHFDSWDFSIRGGLFGGIRVVTMVEEHGSGRQLFRFRAWPTPMLCSILAVAGLVMLAALAMVDDAWITGTLLGSTAASLGALTYADCAQAMTHWVDSLQRYLRQNALMRLDEEQKLASTVALHE
jgi:hypothetical protein